MSNGRAFDKPSFYQIRVSGNLDSKWSEWFEDFTVIGQANGQTVLTGQIKDQAALYGLLAKMGSIGLPLLSVTRIELKEVTDVGRERHFEHNSYR